MLFKKKKNNRPGSANGLWQLQEEAVQMLSQWVCNHHKAMVTQPPVGFLICSRSTQKVIYHHPKQVCYQGYHEPMVSAHSHGIAGIWEGLGEQVCSENAENFSLKLVQSFSKSVSWLT